MTPEEATQLYNIEQRKYYEYCGYVVSYQNKIGEYQSERQNKCVQVENKQTEIQKNKELFEAISGTTGVHDDLFSHLTKINSKVEDATLRKNLCKFKNCDKSDILERLKNNRSNFFTVYNGYCNLSRFFGYQPAGMESG